MKFSNLFLCVFGHFFTWFSDCSNLQTKVHRQQRNIGSMNIHAVVLPSMLQMRLVQQKDNKKCWTTCWTNFFSLSFLDHRLSAPKILFP